MNFLQNSWTFLSKNQDITEKLDILFWKKNEFPELRERQAWFTYWYCYPMIGDGQILRRRGQELLDLDGVLRLHPGLERPPVLDQQQRGKVFVDSPTLTLKQLPQFPERDMITLFNFTHLSSSWRYWFTEKETLFWPFLSYFFNPSFSNQRKG